MTFERSSAVKLQTPIDLVWPSSLAFIMPPQLLTYLSGIARAGQWMR